MDSLLGAKSLIGVSNTSGKRETGTVFWMLSNQLGFDHPLRSNVNTICSRVPISCSIKSFVVDVTVAERGQVGTGVKKNPTQMWPYFFLILFNSFPNFSSNFRFFLSFPY